MPDRWYMPGTLGVGTEFQETIGVQNPAWDSIGTAIRFDGRETLNLLDGRPAPPAPPFETHGPSVNWWSTNAQGRAVRLGSISALFSATAEGSSTGYLSLSTRAAGGDVAEALRITEQAAVVVDPQGKNAGALRPGLTFGGSTSGEGIASRRAAGANQYGLDFYTGGGTVRMSLTNGGWLGLGTTAPKNMLDVAGDVAIQGKHALRGNDAWLRLNQDLAFSAGVHTPGVFAPVSLNVGGVNGWANPGGNNAWIAGSLSIGSPQPQLGHPFHVKTAWSLVGLDTLALNQHAGVRLMENGAFKWHIWNNGSAGGNVLSINSASGQGMWISQGGEVNYTRLVKLDVGNSFQGIVRCADFMIGEASRRGTPGRAMVDNGSTLVVNFGPDWPNVHIDGNVRQGSSRVHKENIQLLEREDALRMVRELRPVAFNFRGSSEACLGFIAEEVPASVASPDRRAISPVGIVAMLAKALQEQMQAVDRLTSELADLRQRCGLRP